MSKNTTAAKAAMAATLDELAQRRATVYADVKPSRSGLSARVRLWYIGDGRLVPLKPDASEAAPGEWREIYRDAGCDPETWAWKVQGCGMERTFQALAKAARWAGMPDPYGVAGAIRREVL
jgi:hypothetical protein